MNGWKRWDRLAKKWLWVLTLIGVLAALPLGFERMKMEKSADTVEYVFDYRDIVEVAEQQAHPAVFLDEHLDLLKDAGITTMAVYESTLKELSQAGRLTYYNERDVALLQGKVPDEYANRSYILFAGDKEAEMIGPVLQEAFDRKGYSYKEWTLQGRRGYVVDQPLAAVALQTMDFDPIALQTIHDKGFQIIGRFSDRVTPYDSERTERQLKQLQSYGVTRLLFEGDTVKGYKDQAALKSLDSFGELLNQYGIGLTTIENLKQPQTGLNKLAYLTDYNVVRLYSLSPEDSIEMTTEGIADRFLLAAKDRNIRMFFLNTMVQASMDEGKLNNSVEKLASSMRGEDGVIATLSDAGFPSGQAQAFKYDQPSWAKPLRAVVMLSAIAMIALLISAYVPNVAIPVFLIGLLGAAGLYVLNSSLMAQALALGVAVSAPTLGLIWVMNRIYARTIGERRMIGGEVWKIGGASQPEQVQEHSERLIWIFPKLSVGRRLSAAISWFVVATLISWTAIPLVFGLLNNITYNLVLEQFRGVSVLYFAPLVLVAIYVFLYEGSSARGVVSRTIGILKQPITVLWVVVVAVLAVAGMYYLSRSGNSGQATSLELTFRTWLENTFGVRPRFKEFVLGHPPLLLGLFLALRYRAAWVLIIVGCLGQLSMVSTFTHLHTPLVISTIRTLLGLGAGLILGAVLIAAWIVLEGAWMKWLQPQIRKYSA